MVRLPRSSPLRTGSRRGKNRKNGDTPGSRGTGRSGGTTRHEPARPDNSRGTSKKKTGPVAAVDLATERANQIVQTWLNTLPQDTRVTAGGPPYRGMLQKMIEDSLRSPPSADPPGQ